MGRPEEGRRSSSGSKNRESGVIGTRRKKEGQGGETRSSGAALSPRESRMYLIRKLKKTKKGLTEDRKGDWGVGRDQWEGKKK